MVEGLIEIIGLKKSVREIGCRMVLESELKSCSLVKNRTSNRLYKTFQI
jgi:hypothetical protein